LPEVAEEMNAHEFDFFLVTDVCGFDEGDPVVVPDAKGDGDDVAMVDVALEQEMGVALADFAFIELEVDVLLVGFAEGVDGGEQFEEFFMGEFLGGIGVERLVEAMGGKGGSAGGQAAGGAEESAGVMGIGFEKVEGNLGIGPALETGFAPVGEVLGSDGLAVEVFGEGGLDGGEGIEPGNEFGGGLEVAQAAVELFAEVVGQTGNFAGKRFHRC
jgi:hypothetical protein